MLLLSHICTLFFYSVFTLVANLQYTYIVLINKQKEIKEIMQSGKPQLQMLKYFHYMQQHCANTNHTLLLTQLLSDIYD